MGIKGNQTSTAAVIYHDAAIACQLAKGETMDSKIYTSEEIKAGNAQQKLIAVCESGAEYEAVFVPEYKAIFFTIPAAETIKGYRKA